MSSRRRERARDRVERQLLLLLSLFAVATLSPIVAMELEILRIPLQTLNAWVAGVFVITAIILVRGLRRRLGLLERLERHTRHIIRGDYAHRVKIRETDEFQSLGRAFNEMTDQLQASLLSNQSVADIDRLILSSAGLDAVVRKVLLSARLDGVEVALVLRWGRGQRGVIHYHLDDRTLLEEALDTSVIPEDNFRDSQGYEMLARRLYGEQLELVLPVAAESSTMGVLIAASDRSLAASESTKLTDLADRLSVAITNIQRSETLFKKAHFDELTGLINRHSFQEKLREQISRSWRGEKGAVLFIDLDGFKKVNDTEGHKAGDALLVIIAERLRSCLRDVDTIARMGGDEFAVIVPGCDDEKSISRLCERIITEAIKPVVVDRMEHTVGASIGVAVFPDDGKAVEELIMKADAAMYRAKENGRACFAFFDDTLNEANRHRVLVESRLRNALAQGELMLHFQPKLALADQSVTSAEALIRWTDDVLGTVGPDEFVPIAEETNLIHDFTAVQISRTADLIFSADRAGIQLESIAVNASARQLMTEGFALALLSQLDQRMLPHNKLEIEVTESVFAHDKARVVSELEILQAAGIRIALDDFGTGFSSLNMLRELPLDVVKIDRSFITEIDSSEQARVLVQHLISIATTLGKQVVAEGVETELQLKHLEAANCHYVQGFLVSRALPMDAFLRLLGDWQNDTGRRKLKLI